MAPSVKVVAEYEIVGENDKVWDIIDKLAEKKIKTLSFIEELNGDTKIEIEWNGNVEKSQKDEMMNMLNKVFLRLKHDMVIYDFEIMRIRVWDKSYIRKIIILEENYNTLFKDFIKEFCL